MLNYQRVAETIGQSHVLSISGSGMNYYFGIGRNPGLVIVTLIRIVALCSNAWLRLIFAISRFHRKLLVVSEPIIFFIDNEITSYDSAETGGMNM